MKISQDVDAHRRFPEIKQVETRREHDAILLTRPGEIGWGGNSGFQALNLVAQFCASKVILVGYDMRLDRGLHWHGPHPDGQNNPLAKNVERWRRAIDNAAEIFAALDVPVINTSPISALKAYPHMSLEDALNVETAHRGHDEACYAAEGEAAAAD
jgi:hypothetical protein